MFDCGCVKVGISVCVKLKVIKITAETLHCLVVIETTEFLNSISFCLQYPEALRKYEYIPNFAVRGLHYDVQKVRGSLLS